MRQNWQHEVKVLRAVQMRVLLLARVPGGGLERRPQGRVQADPAQTAECQLKTHHHHQFPNRSTITINTKKNTNTRLRLRSCSTFEFVGPCVCALRACARVRVPTRLPSFSSYPSTRRRWLLAARATAFLLLSETQSLRRQKLHDGTRCPSLP